MKEVGHQKKKYSKDPVCARKLLGHRKENYDKPVFEDNQQVVVYNTHKVDNCLIIINASSGNEGRFPQENMFKTIDKSKTGPEDTSYKLKRFTEKIIEDNNSRKYNNISTYKKADNKEIRIRGKDIQEKEDLEATYIFDKCSNNEVLTSMP